MSIDRFDAAILRSLQADGSLTNAALSERVNLSPSQCSRRRASLESRGYIQAYRAELDGRKLGFGIEALTRVTLAVHSETSAEEFASFVAALDEVELAQALTGDADYMLHLRARSLEELAEFIHHRLLPHPLVSQVRSDIVLKTVKPRSGLPVQPD